MVWPKPPEVNISSKADKSPSYYHDSSSRHPLVHLRAATPPKKIWSGAKPCAAWKYGSALTLSLKPDFYMFSDCVLGAWWKNYWNGLALSAWFPSARFSLMVGIYRPESKNDFPPASGIFHPRFIQTRPYSILANFLDRSTWERNCFACDTGPSTAGHRKKARCSMQPRQ